MLKTKTVSQYFTGQPGGKYLRCTVAFFGETGAILGSQLVEIESSRAGDRDLVEWIQADQLKRRSPAGAVRALLLVGQLNYAQFRAAMGAKEAAHV